MRVIILKMTQSIMTLCGMVTRKFACALLSALLYNALLAGLAEAQMLGQNERYVDCMRSARSNPEQGLETALTWSELGGGEAADHCAAAAMMGLRQYAQAAKRFELLAQKLPANAPKSVRADVLAQAGRAWSAAGDGKKALGAQNAALVLVPNNADTLTDRAVTFSDLGKYWEAIDDLNAALDINPAAIEALTLRASAYRFVDAMPLARQDAESALALNPRYPEALLEYGIVLRLMGDVAGARNAWLQLAQDQDGRPIAEVARRNLEKLDVRTK